MTEEEELELENISIKLVKLVYNSRKTKQALEQNIEIKAHKNGFTLHALREKLELSAQDEPHIDNGIKKGSISKDFNNLTLEEENLMKLNKGIRKRKDGRYDWRKTLGGVDHYLINSDLKILVKQVAEYKKNVINNTLKPKKAKKSKKLIDLAWRWFELNKKGKIASEKQYVSRLKNNISQLNKSISAYTKNDIVEFLNNINEHRTREYCYIIIKNVFAEAAETGLIDRNIVATLKNNKGKGEKGLWYNIEEQKKIYSNRHKTGIGSEIEFFIMVGCRLSEAYNCRLELDKNRIWVERTKSDESSGYVKISPAYARHLSKNWDKMFKMPSDYYSKRMINLLVLLGIKRQKNEKPVHRLRHTFATNLFYLGVNDKIRAYLMGHKSPRLTNDVYTDFDIDVSRAEIYQIYGDLYPNFDPKN